MSHLTLDFVADEDQQQPMSLNSASELTAQLQVNGRHHHHHHRMDQPRRRAETTSDAMTSSGAVATSSMQIQHEAMQQKALTSEMAGDIILHTVTTAFMDSMKYAAALVRASDLSIIHYNSAACAMLGYASDDVLHAPLSLLFPAWRLDRRPSQLMRVQSPTSQSFDPATVPLSVNMDLEALLRQRKSQIMQAKKKDGSLLWVEVTVSELAQSLSESLASIGPMDRCLLVTLRELTPLELAARQSRYESEFEELERIGRGAYGSVYRARNRIDGQEYAIKKVKLRGCDKSALKEDAVFDDRLIREVKTFARISGHPNVVRYYAAWTEPIVAQEPSVSIAEMPQPPLASVQPSTSWTTTGYRTDEFEDLLDQDRFAVTRQDDADADIFFEYDDAPPHLTSSPSEASPSSATDEDTLKTYTTNAPFQAKPRSRTKTHARKRSDKFKRRSRSTNMTGSASTGDNAAVAILYIQMQLCPFNDLRRWLDARGSAVDVETNLRLFRQIVDGLAHIHRLHFVHRDVKPENIFVQDGHVFLGDFGLAKSVADQVIVGSPEQTLAHRDDDGTYLYMSPEQVHRQRMSDKSDIYALGIIFVELFQPFSTYMERAVVLTRLRSQLQMPADMMAKFPLESAFALRLLAPNPEDRPSAEDILLDPMFASLVASVSSLASPSLDQKSMTSLQRVDASWSSAGTQTRTLFTTAESPLGTSLHSNPGELVISTNAYAPSFTTTSSSPDADRVRLLESTVAALMKEVQDLRVQLAASQQQQPPKPATSTPITPLVSTSKRCLRPGERRKAHRMSAPSIVTAVSNEAVSAGVLDRSSPLLRSLSNLRCSSASSTSRSLPSTSTD